MLLSPGRSNSPPTPELVRELLLRITRGQPGLAPDALRAYLRPLVKRVVLTGCGPRGLAHWVSRQRGTNPPAADPPALVTELTSRLVETLLPPADPFTGTVIDRLW
jgi:hypothetical protein